MLRWFLDTLGIDVEIRSAGDWNFQGEKSDLVLNMCIQLKAKNYIFGSEGINYADISRFTNSLIKVHFQKYKHPTYPQLDEKFTPNLSIVDLLFNCGPESLDILMSNNLTKKDILKAR